MKPLITKAQGIACRKAAEYIAAGFWNGRLIRRLPCSERSMCALDAIGWCFGVDDYFSEEHADHYNQSEVLMALLWCAEIAGEA